MAIGKSTDTVRRTCLHRIACTALLLLLAVLSACSTLPFGGAENRPIKYNNLPALSSYLTAQPQMVICSSQTTAKYMANTGLFIEGCELLTESGRWKVIACEHVELYEGGLWLLQTQSDDGTQGWVPVPWHDWI